jgi:iron-sulfur cluster repair protein YtfE (RIC family)
MTGLTTADRLHAAAAQLAGIHDGLRQDLARLRSQAQAFGTGGARPSLATRLTEHCVAFCDAVHQHHTGEDDLAFPYLDEAIPEMRPVLDRLRQDHVLVAQHVAALRHLVRTVQPDTVGDLLERLEQISGDLDRHFTYEEDALIPAMRNLR